MTLIHQRQYNVQPSALGKCNSTIISFHFCLLKLSQQAAELAMHRAHFPRWTFTIFRINIKDILYSHSSRIFNKHSETLFL